MTKTIHFELNGEPVTTQVETHHNVVELLERLGLRGARESCAQGLCGCCTVLVDGQAVSGCLHFAVRLDGTRVETIEAGGPDGRLDEVQQAFAECGAFQCGFCTPGFVLMSRQLLDAKPEPTADEIRHYLSGNLCRCAAYPEIVRAVQRAAELRKASGR
jgi:carbon-monoxide dehydrogenase small subunit